MVDSQDRRLTLLIDADDTLWENNVYFLEVTEHLLDTVEQFGVDRETAREFLVETERQNIRLHGYGSRSFAVSVVEACRALAPGVTPQSLERLRLLAYSIYQRDQLEIRVGVHAALQCLREHHRLILVTKGDKEEQDRKLEISGLGQHFEWVEVVAEKDVATYLELIQRLKLDPASTWMIGNSPRSDINPALCAGLSAILIPHPQTWELEIEELERTAGGRLLVMDTLEDVARYFTPGIG